MYPTAHTVRSRTDTMRTLGDSFACFKKPGQWNVSTTHLPGQSRFVREEETLARVELPAMEGFPAAVLLGREDMGNAARSPLIMRPFVLEALPSASRALRSGTGPVSEWGFPWFSTHRQTTV
jgi:hypothetical protein